MIGIIDYGMGNIHSVKKALERMGGAVEVVNEPARLAAAAKLVLPGVGAFGDAMGELERCSLIPAVNAAIDAGKPFLGICLGMHLLFEASEESPGVKGLARLQGTVRKFRPLPGLKIPQMGWNTIRRRNDCPLLKGLPENAGVYFCHSFYPEAADRRVAAATTEYGIEFASVVWSGNVFACQFHPEKSQSAGLGILKNFIEL